MMSLLVSYTATGPLIYKRCAVVVVHVLFVAMANDFATYR